MIYPDLAPSDFHLFPNLKKFVSGMCFMSKEEVEYILRAFHSHFQEEIVILEKYWTECVEVNRDYVEK